MKRFPQFVFYLLFFFIFTPLVQGQDMGYGNNFLPDTTDNNSFGTPYHTTFTFFYNLKEQNYDPSTAAKALNLTGSEGRNAEALAIKLKQVFDGKGVYVQINEIPNNPNFRDTLRAGKQVYFFDEIALPSVFLEKAGNQ
ncbi:MAG: mechanosensitive ion channel family protein, partial [Cyclobacteriaceae bacterium]